MKKWAYRAAYLKAKQSQYPVYQHGCVIERGGRIVGNAVNIRGSVTPLRDKKNRHAECIAIRGCHGNTCGATLYVVRVTHGKVRFSRPCTRCRAEIIAAGIAQVVYSISENELGIWEPRLSYSKKEIDLVQSSE